MSTAATFRKLALALGGAVESAHMGHPDFRAGGRIFASLSPDEATGTVKLTPEQQQAMLAAEPRSFRPASGAWGRSGWTIALLAATPRPVLATVLELAHENVTSQPARKSTGQKKTAAGKPRKAAKSVGKKARPIKLMKSAQTRRATGSPAEGKPGPQGG